tara:strand:- start:180 stop:1508 length:1329 start_codon:yes stop_codon:yes gene_type:complete
MAQHKVIDLINQFMEDHGQSSGKDRVMLWLEDVYSKIRSLPWSWNFKVTETQTGGGLVSNPVITSVDTTETFYWGQGSNYIQSTISEVSAVNGVYTGRYIYIDNEWYQCLRIAPTGDLNKIYLDKKIVAESQSLQTISFYRRDLAFQTNGIKSVHVDDIKLEHLTEEQIYRFKRGIDPRWYYGDSGDPLSYHIDEKQIGPPKHAPVVEETTGSTLTEIGTHVLFWTFRDMETGQESAPGPSTEFTVTASTGELKVQYGVGTVTGGYSSDETSYSRILYISKKRTSYTRNPMYEVADKYHSATTTYTWSLTDISLEILPIYYDGPWTKFVMYPAPDVYNRAEVLHIDSYPGLPGEQNILKLGRQREFIELFHLYFLMKQSLQNKDPSQFRVMQGSFREQLNFLLAQDGDDRRLDPSSWEYKFFTPSSAVSRDEDFTSSLKYPF